MGPYLLEVDLNVSSHSSNPQRGCMLRDVLAGMNLCAGLSCDMALLVRSISETSSSCTLRAGCRVQGAGFRVQG